jgi:hypothetical protein
MGRLAVSLARTAAVSLTGGIDSERRSAAAGMSGARSFSRLVAIA